MNSSISQWREREREAESNTERERQRQRDRERQGETDRDRKKEMAEYWTAVPRPSRPSWSEEDQWRGNSQLDPSWPAVLQVLEPVSHSCKTTTQKQKHRYQGNVHKSTSSQKPAGDMHFMANNASGRWSRCTDLTQPHRHRFQLNVHKSRSSQQLVAETFF